MIIKSFSARTVGDALKLVRDELGGDAIVLCTREAQSDLEAARVEVTACIDRQVVSRREVSRLQTPSTKRNPAPHSAKKPTVLPTAVRLQPQGISDYDAGQDLYSGLAELHRKLDSLLVSASPSTGLGRQYGALHDMYERLRDADMPDQFIATFMDSVLSECNDSPDATVFARRKLVDQLSELMLPSLCLEPGDSVVFLGLPGVGKSSVMGKLAARLVSQEKQKVTLAGLDYHKVGAHDELAGYGDILDVDVRDLSDESQTPNVTDGITLIDGPAVPSDAAMFERLKQQVARLNPRFRVVVFSALTRTGDLTHLVPKLQVLAPTHLIVTMLDQTPRWGSAITAATSLNTPIVFTTDSPSATSPLKSPDPDAFVRHLLGLEVCLE